MISDTVLARTEVVCGTVFRDDYDGDVAVDTACMVVSDGITTDTIYVSNDGGYCFSLSALDSEMISVDITITALEFDTLYETITLPSLHDPTSIHKKDFHVAGYGFLMHPKVGDIWRWNAKARMEIRTAGLGWLGTTDWEGVEEWRVVSISHSIYGTFIRVDVDFTGTIDWNNENMQVDTTVVIDHLQTSQLLVNTEGYFDVAQDGEYSFDSVLELFALSRCHYNVGKPIIWGSLHTSDLTTFMCNNSFDCYECYSEQEYTTLNGPGFVYYSHTNSKYGYDSFLELELIEYTQTQNR